MASHALLLYTGLILFWLCQALDKPEELLIGWQGETYTHRRDGPGGDGSEPPDDRKDADAWIQVLSWKPRAFVYHGFLSRAEIRHILHLAAPQMKRSTVVGANNSGVVDSIRTSAGTFLMRNQDAITRRIDERLAVWSHLPASHQEDMQVLRYGPTNRYGSHHDGLGRVMSVLMYLVAPEEGGETAFPQSSGWLHPEVGEPTQGPFSPCAKGHVAFKPKEGDALMFYDKTVGGVDDDMLSMHTGCPVIKGVKWNAVKWIHGKPFRLEEYEESLRRGRDPIVDPGLCTDTHDMCPQWAAAGECQKNSGYMMGGSSGQGVCRKACKECTPCHEDDAPCIARNRDKAGFMSFDKSEFKGLW